MSTQPTNALLALQSLDDHRVVFSSPLLVEARREPEGVTILHPESDVFGFGSDEVEALDDFRRALAELFLVLDAERDNLGPALRETLRVLDSSVRKLS